MLDSLPDRIAYREVVLPPPPGLLPPQLHPSQMSDRARQGLATPGRVGVHRQRPAGAQPQPHERWTGLWAPESGRHGSSGPSGGGTPSRSGGAGGGRAVGLTERERMLQDARTRAAAAAAAAAAGEEQGLPPGRRTGPRVRFRDDGRDASPQSDQGLRTRERDGGGERVEAEKGQGSGGEADDVWVPDAGGPEGAALRHLHQMGELAAAHQDAAMWVGAAWFAVGRESVARPGRSVTGCTVAILCAHGCLHRITCTLCSLGAHVSAKLCPFRHARQAPQAAA